MSKKSRKVLIVRVLEEVFEQFKKVLADEDTTAQEVLSRAVKNYIKKNTKGDSK